MSDRPLPTLAELQRLLRDEKLAAAVAEALRSIRDAPTISDAPIDAERTLAPPENYSIIETDNGWHYRGPLLGQYCYPLRSRIEAIAGAWKAYAEDLTCEIEIYRRTPTISDAAGVPTGFDAALACIPADWRVHLEKLPIDSGPRWLAATRPHAGDGGESSWRETATEALEEAATAAGLSATPPPPVVVGDIGPTDAFHATCPSCGAGVDVIPAQRALSPGDQP